MICPKCHAEYFEDNEKCGDCNLELIDACSIDIPIPDMHWVALKPIYSSTTADMITEILNNEEIPHYAKSDWASSALNTSGNSLIDNIVRIFIPKLYEKQLKTLEGAFPASVQPQRVLNLSVVLNLFAGSEWGV